MNEIEEILGLNVKICRSLRYNLQNKPTIYDYIIEAFKIFLTFKHSLRGGGLRGRLTPSPRPINTPLYFVRSTI